MGWMGSSVRAGLVSPGYSENAKHLDCATPPDSGRKKKKAGIGRRVAVREGIRLAS